MTPRAFNAAVIGYGLSAKVFHIPLILAVPELKLYGIVQRSPSPDNDASAAHPGIKSWRSVEDVYSDPSVDIVVITSTPETHFHMCKAALQAGKHVVVEKPFVPTSHEAAELIEVSQKCGRLLTVYQNRRWDADFLTLQKVIAEGSLGDVAEFETHFDRHRPAPPPDNWKAQEGPAHGSIYDLGTHLIDQVYHLFGMPQRVTGFVGNQRRGVTGGAADSHTVLLHYEGMLATVKAGVISPEVEQLRYWVRGTRGSFKKVGVVAVDNHWREMSDTIQFHLDVQEGQLRAGLRPGDKDFGVDPEENYGSLTTVQHEKDAPNRKTYPTVEPIGYVEFYRTLANALAGQGDVPVKAEDARDVLRIIELALRSSSEGRTIAI